MSAMYIEKDKNAFFVSVIGVNSSIVFKRKATRVITYNSKMFSTLTKAFLSSTGIFNDRNTAFVIRR